MREIKFRVWRPNKKEMSIGMPLPMLAGYITAIYAIYPGLGEEVYLQFTGLKDKNGKEIYEGDILKWDQVNDIDIVEWMDGDACYKSILNGLDSAACAYYEVIGNIYENEELVKK